ncbi:unnamed protein product [Acanthoscelides obtectus]|uniref:Uncharacterized protein n=1 Tax=Acanthoscelides obtectus TaxID=200917 RepID=A0A9P0NZA7_ACAOB|nr:unnamed protein product [Acanthoscelides obtectus]CAK1621877.1 hypothetical protein AOBTE_LOCUS1194 [Acanthoscelides obtectus]
MTAKTRYMKSRNSCSPTKADEVTNAVIESNADDWFCIICQECTIGCTKAVIHFPAEIGIFVTCVPKIPVEEFNK